MSTSRFEIHFRDVTASEANALASSLREAIQDSGPGVDVQQLRLRPDAQDFGTVLGVVLGTAAVEAVAKGIGSWISRHSGASIELVREGQSVLRANNIDSRDAAKILAAIRTPGG